MRVCESFRARNTHYWRIIIYRSLIDKLYIVYRNYSQSKSANCFKQWKCRKFRATIHCLVLGVATVAAFTLHVCVLMQIHGLYLADIGSSCVSRVMRNCCAYEGFVHTWRAHTWHISDTRPEGICTYILRTAVDKIMTKVNLGFERFKAITRFVKVTYAYF
jgi:hypothetical protein